MSVDPVESLCTPEQAIAAAGYLRLAYGGYAIPEPEDRALVRLFRHYPPAELQAAIDELVVKRPERRPGPSEIAEYIREKHRAAQTTVDPEPWSEVDPDYVTAKLNEIRQAVPALRRRP